MRFRPAFFCLVLASGLIGCTTRLREGMGPFTRPASENCVMPLREGQKFYVAPDGSDSNPGTLQAPLRTFGAAILAVRAFRAETAGTQAATSYAGGPVTVYFREGRYFVDNVVLSAGDSGSGRVPISYSGYPGENAILSGARKITGFAAVTDSGVLSRLPASARGNVLSVHLPSQGVTDYGTAVNHGGFLPVKPMPLELFVDGRRMPLARYPNEGWAFIADPVAGRAAFRYVDPRPSKWQSHDGVFVTGFFSNTWADATYEVGSLDTGTQTLHVTGPVDPYGFRRNQWFAYVNVLEELDSPGEYFLDRATGNLYFWPPSDPAAADVTVSMANKLVVGNGLSHIRFENLAFEGARSNLVDISDSHHLEFSRVSFGSAGNDALKLTNVTHSKILDSEFSQLAEGAIYLKGGDRTTLTPSGNLIRNNHIHDTSQVVKTGRPAIALEGVGTEIAHNEFHDIPQHAVRFNGNDHRIHKNDFHDVVTEVPPDAQTADTGVVYHGRDDTARGNVISDNRFKDIGRGKMISGAVYLDDHSSGQRVSGNLFDNAGCAMMIGGGRYNTIDNNVIVNTTRPIVFDSRGYQSPTRSEWMSNRFYNPVTDASRTSPIVVTLANRHGISAGSATAPKKMDVSGVMGNTAANGTWPYEVVSPNQLRLLGTSSNGDYSGGGEVVATGSAFYSQLNAVNYSGSPYHKYPGIFDYDRYRLGDPIQNHFTRNIIFIGDKPPGPWISMYASTPPFLNFSGGLIHGADPSVVVPSGNLVASPEFVDGVSGDYRLKTSSPAFSFGFTELKYEEMGRIPLEGCAEAGP